MSIYFDIETINELKENNFYRQQREFTLDELAQYDGRNENPAYIAMEGIVYDISQESSWGEGTNYGLNAGQDVTEQFNSSHGMIGILNNAPRVGILVDDNDMSFSASRNMNNRQVKQNTSNFRPDDWIRYIEPLVTYSLRESSQGTGLQGNNSRRLYQKAILLGVLVGLGRTPQESINQVQQWQNTGASTLLGGPSTGSGMGTGGTTSGGMGTGGTTGSGMGTGGTTGGGMGTGGTTGGGMGTGGTTGSGMGTGGTTGGGIGTGGTTSGGSTGTRDDSVVRNRLFFD